MWRVAWTLLEARKGGGHRCVSLAAEWQGMLARRSFAALESCRCADLPPWFNISNLEDDMVLNDGLERPVYWLR